MILAALALALQAAPPPAASPRLMVSVGYYTCEDWGRERHLATWRTEKGMDTRPVTRMEQWVWGYLTAFKRYERPTRDIRLVTLPNREDPIWKQLDTYCAAHPQKMLEEAVSILVEPLRRRPSRRR